MNGDYRLLPAVAGLFLAPAAMAATGALPITDPHLAELHEAITGWEKLTQRADFMDFPAQPAAWPCPVADLELRKAAGLLRPSELSLSEQRVRLATIRRLGGNVGPSDANFQNIRSHPLRSECVGGKLEGEAEYLLLHDAVEDTPSLTIAYQLSVRVRAHFRAGLIDESRGVLLVQQVDNSRITFKNPDMQKMMEATKTPPASSRTIIAKSSLQPFQGYELSRLVTAVGSKQEVPVTTTVAPFGEGRRLHSVYRGSDKWQEYRTWAGLHHGVHQTFPIRLNGFAMPAETKCYQDGEEIKTVQCDVE